MALCKKCGKWLKQTEGRRPKEFCNNTCRSNYWYAKNKKEQQTTNIQDLNQTTGQIKPFEPPKTNYSINVSPSQETPKLSIYEGYRLSIVESKNMDELKPILSAIQSDINLADWQKKNLQIFAQNHSREFYND